jgi:putative ABC transport system permease protein
VTALVADSRVRPGDLLREGSLGLRTRRLRAALSALGIAIGIASMVAVLGISSSSKADLLTALDRLGTNLLTLTPGQSFLGDEASIPAKAAAKLSHLSIVQRASGVVLIDDATVRRSPYVDPAETNGIGVYAADAGLARTLGATLRAGRFLTAADQRYPTVVLGAVAARRLGMTAGGGGRQVWIGDQLFTVVGVLDPLTLAPELDRAALISLPAARSLFGTKPQPSQVYVRTDPARVTEAAAILPANADPENPENVSVSRPSDVLAARAKARTAFTSLFLGLGAVALLVGGVGIANVMVISVVERRSEIGLRRALGATRRHIGGQFVCEALLLSLAGGVAGAVLGSGATVAYALSQGWQAVVPPGAIAGGVAAAIAIGAVAGLYPAIRAARLSPTEALRAV